MKRFFVVCLFSMLTAISFGQSFQDTLRNKIAGLYEQGHLPGFAVVVLNEDGVVYEEAFGYADLERKKAYTLETVQIIASTTKTTIAFAVMKLIEEGKLELDSPINEFLPYDVHNPHFKDKEITIRHLVTHTAGLIDTENNYDLRGRYFTKETSLSNVKFDEDDLEYFELLRKNEKVSLKKYCTAVFSEKGEWKDDGTFLKHQPGSHYHYSNLGAVLTAHIVERVSGDDFDKYIDKHLFSQLGMSSSTFDLDEVNMDIMSKMYVREDFVATPYFGENTYPDGGMISSAKDLTVYLTEMIKGYRGNSSLLNENIFELMMSPKLDDEVSLSEDVGRNFNNIGVFWQFGNDEMIMHHGGYTLGGTVYFGFNPETGIGRILMTNCDARVNRETIVEFVSVWKIAGMF